MNTGRGSSTDSQVMVESLIENVHRANLKPIEQAKAILEVFKASKLSVPGTLIDDELSQKISNIKPETNGASEGDTGGFQGV